MPAPSSTPNLHTLIAFAAKLFKHSTTPNTYRWRKYTTATDKTCLLDAIAVICAQGSQTVAVALTLDIRTYEVRLLISQSPSTDTPLLEHVEKTWEMLGRLAGYHRSGNTNSAIAVRVHLTRYMYKRFWPQLTKAVDDWWPALDAAHRNFGRWMRKRELEKPEDRFQRAMFALRMAIPILKCEVEQLSTKSWCTLVWRMRVAAHYVSALLKAWDGCKDWGYEFNDEYHGGFSPVRCALSEITNLQRHLAILVNFAYSPRPSNVFDYTLRVSFPVSVPRSIHLPDSLAEWGSVIKYLIAGWELVNPTWAMTKAAELFETYEPTQMLAPHPGLALIAHLESITGTNPPIGYIGVSRPLCSATVLWITDYNERGRRVYEYRGYPHRYQRINRGDHGHWEWPWCAPNTKMKDMSKEVASGCKWFMQDNRMLEDKYHYRYRSRGSSPDQEAILECMAEMKRDMEKRKTLGCVFGCIGTTECFCLDVLEGMVVPKVETEETEDDDTEDDDFW